ncbi:hypothetical protein [Ancylomarina sp. 16SWW S1-10-2]|uniref:hypothetical protein n=1 Tax=Ancylomarina sp. 16SWW S1-10-2 TaxID=2499681 RepID=UPI0012AE0ECB|nr:hypothetical protein [Ancylomarina sp. 16SWW S1-10-2]MRT94448.1 hypothetical protein [Ancylomarina sp. 16SWW S1-10-2]
MLLKVFRRRSPIYFILIPIIAFLLCFNAFQNPALLAEYSLQMPLYQALLCILDCNPLYLNIFGFVVILIISYSLIQLNEQFIFIKQRTDLPSALFILLASCAILINGLHPALISALLLLLSLNRVFKIYHANQSISSAFDVGVLIGLSSLFYLPSALFFLWFIWALIILGAFRLREFMSGLIGFFIPIFFALCWFFWQGNLEDIIDQTKMIFEHQEHLVSFSISHILYWIFLALLSLISIFFTIWGFEEKRVRSRKYLLILVALFITSIASGILFPSAIIAQIFIAAVPLSYIYSYFFVMNRNTKISEIIFGILVIGSLLLKVL